MVGDKWSNGDWHWNWARENIGSRNNQLLADLREVLGDCILHDRCDRWICSLNTDGMFTVKTVRDTLDRVVLPSTNVSTIWFKFLPRKVNIFLWRLRIDFLPVRWNLSAKGIEINSVVSPLCNIGIETRDHLFFDCDTAKELWLKSAGLA
ncbi:uncharacterized protein [Rutidosis leptorrhynchoides]|uniref:uncharacterized protein n=1 Tax=Rutidosis leptorrhynchoides TaxID=125765 RepID=UPI003A990E94